MDDFKANTQLIERYFDKQLSEEELNHFNEQLVTNPEFKAAFETEKDLLEGLEMAGNLDLKKQLQQIHQETIPTLATKKSPFISRRIWLIAATFTGIGLLFWFLFPTEKLTAAKLYAEFAQHDFDFQEKNTSNKLLAKAENLLRSKQYEAALPLLETHLKKYPDDAQILLAKGIALMEIGQDYESALAVFRRLETDFPIYRNEAFWYEGLLFLKRGNIKDSYDALEQISSDSRRYNLSKEILMKLDKL